MNQFAFHAPFVVSMKSFTAPEWFDPLSWTLIHSLWQLPLIALLLCVALMLIPSRSATARYNVACLALLFAGLIPLLTFVQALPASTVPADSSLATSVGKHHFNHQGQQYDSPDETASHAESLSRSESLETVHPRESLREKSPAAVSVPTYNVAERWSEWLAIVWMAGVLVFMLRPALGLTHERRLRCAGRQPPPRGLEVRFAALRQTLGIRNNVALSLSDRVSVPTVMGIVRPLILLPTSALTLLTSDELDAILWHELAHIRRLDLLVNLFQSILETLFFFHPAMWWMSITIRHLREECCDDLAVQASGNSGSLIRALLSLEVSRQSTLSTIGANGGSLVRRIRRLAPPSSARRAALDSTVPRILTMLTVACLIGGGLAWQASFAARTLRGVHPIATHEAAQEQDSAQPHEVNQVDEAKFTSFGELEEIPPTIRRLVYAGPDEGGPEDDGLKLIASRFPNLEELDLGDGSAITDDGLLHLTNLQKLRHLRLRSARRLTTKSAETLTGIDQLAVLDISESPALLEDDAVTQLLRLPRLTSLIALRRTVGGYTRDVLEPMLAKSTLEQIYLTRQHPLNSYVHSFNPSHLKFTFVDDAISVDYFTIACRFERTTRERRAYREVVQVQRQANEQAYLKNKESLWRDHAQEWVVIVDGSVETGFADFTSARASLDDRAIEPHHAFIFRPQVDDLGDHIVLASWPQPKSTIENQARQFGLLPGSEPDQQDTDTSGSEHTDLQAPSEEVLDNGIIGIRWLGKPMLITEDDAYRLRLDRFSIPGQSRSLTYQVDCYKVHVSGIDAEQGTRLIRTALVLPQEIAEFIKRYPQPLNQHVAPTRYPELGD